MTKEQLEAIREQIMLDDETPYLQKDHAYVVRQSDHCGILLREVDRLTAELQKLKATPVRTGCDECLEERDRLTAKNERLRARVGELETDVGRYLPLLRHMHVAGRENLDECRECGLDLRDPVHTRAALEQP